MEICWKYGNAAPIMAISKIKSDIPILALSCQNDKHYDKHKYGHYIYLFQERVIDKVLLMKPLEQ